MFCEVNILLFSSLLKVIAASVDWWVSGSVGKWSVVVWSVSRWSVDFIKPLLNTPTVISELSHRYFHVRFSEGLQLKLKLKIFLVWL